MIGIIGAMDEEVAQIVEVMDIEKTEEKAGMTFRSGKALRQRCRNRKKRYW